MKGYLDPEYKVKGYLDLRYPIRPSQVSIRAPYIRVNLAEKMPKKMFSIERGNFDNCRKSKHTFATPRDRIKKMPQFFFFSSDDQNRGAPLTRVRLLHTLIRYLFLHLMVEKR